MLHRYGNSKSIFEITIFIIRAWIIIGGILVTRHNPSQYYEFHILYDIIIYKEWLTIVTFCKAIFTKHTKTKYILLQVKCIVKIVWESLSL